MNALARLFVSRKRLCVLQDRSARQSVEHRRVLHREDVVELLGREHGHQRLGVVRACLDERASIASQAQQHAVLLSALSAVAVTVAL